MVLVSRLLLERFSTLVASDAIDETEIEISERSVEKLSCEGDRRIRLETVRADGICWLVLMVLAVLMLLLPVQLLWAAVVALVTMFVVLMQFFGDVIWRDKWCAGRDNQKKKHV